LWATLKEVQVVVAIYNEMNATLLHIGKMVTLYVAITGTYFCITNYHARPAESIFLMFFGYADSAYYIGITKGLHKMGSFITTAKEVLLPTLDHVETKVSLQDQIGDVQYLRKCMENARDSPIKDGEFQKMSELGTVVFLDFYAQPVISLLMAD